MKRWGFILVTIIFVVKGYSQWQNSPKIRWYQLETQHFKVIYPQEIYNQANFVANVLEDIYEFNTKDFKVAPRKIPIVLNPYTSYSNAYVSIAPVKMHWYLMPYNQTFLGFNDWLVDLALHEFRHISQFYLFRRNWWKYYYIFNGDLGWGFAMAYTTPMWFFEGDAVFQETVLSKSGRGRIAHFQMPVMALATTYPKSKLNYYKFYLGSYKTYYPSWYHLGYYMVTYFNTHIGIEKWNRAFKYASWFSFLPNSLNIGLQLATRYSYKKLFDSTFSYLKQQWLQMIDSSDYQTNFISHSKTKVWTNYIEPNFINDTVLVAVKYGYDHAPQIVIPNSKKDKKLREISAVHISTAKNKAVWLEFVYHPRWLEMSYKLLVLYDFNTKQRKVLAKDKFTWVELNKNADRILALCVDSALTYWLKVYDTLGNLLSRVKLPFREVRHPNWLEEDKVVFTGTDLYRGIGLFVLDLQTKNIDTLIPFSWNGTIERPYSDGKYVYFSSDVKGINQIFAISLENKELYRLTNVPFGAYMPKVKDNKLYFIDYTPNGYEINTLYLTSDVYNNSDFTPKKFEFFRSELTDYLIHPYFPDTSNFFRYKAEKYNHFELKPIAWMYYWDYYEYLLNENIRFLGALFLRDVLNESLIGILGDYNFNEKDFTFGGLFYYGRYYPVLNFGFSGKYDLDTGWVELGPVLGIEIPLNLSRDIWYRFADIKLNLGVNQRESFDYNFGFGFSFGNYKQTAYRDVQSRFAQYLSVNGEFRGLYRRFTENFVLSIPGIMRHDVLTFAFSMGQHIGEDSFVFSNTPLGWTDNISTKRYYRFTAFYHSPLLYPDFGYYRLFYIKRLRWKWFFDTLNDFSRNYSSAGLQIWMDFDLFGLKFDITTGLQFSYLIQKGSFNVSPVANLSIPF